MFVLAAWLGFYVVLYFHIYDDKVGNVKLCCFWYISLSFVSVYTFC